MNKLKAIASKGVRPRLTGEIKRIAHIPFVRNLGAYLGFPLKSGRLGSTNFNFIKESIHKKLAYLKTNMRKMAGRV